MAMSNPIMRSEARSSDVGMHDVGMHINSAGETVAPQEPSKPEAEKKKKELLKQDKKGEKPDEKKENKEDQKDKKKELFKEAKKQDKVSTQATCGRDYVQCDSTVLKTLIAHGLTE